MNPKQTELTDKQYDQRRREMEQGNYDGRFEQTGIVPSEQFDNDKSYRKQRGIPEQTDSGKAPRIEEFYQIIEDIHITKADVKPERGVRLYSTSFKRAWNLQIRAPLGVGPFGRRDSNTFVIATVGLDRNQLVLLRDSINAHLEEA